MSIKFRTLVVSANLLLTASASIAAPLYNITTIGLYDAEHTRDDGYKSSGSTALNQNSQVIGSSNRYNGGNTSLGNSVWLYDNNTTTNIGLTSSLYTKNDGSKRSSVTELSETGHITGTSYKYNGGSTSLGRNTWLHSGGTTTIISLTDAEHTNNAGKNDSYGISLNESGQVAGISYRHNSSSANLGQSIWLHSGGATTNIGLTGAEHTRNDGYKRNEFKQLNENGAAIGSTNRYEGGSTELGRTAWLHFNGVTTDISMKGSEHTSSNNQRRSEPGKFFLQTNEVIGSSYRYNGGLTYLGQTAWLYSNGTTTNIGLTGSEYTRNDGYQYSSVGVGNEAGVLTGISHRFNNGSTDLGFQRWIRDGATTTLIGLTGSEHTRDDGYRSGSFLKLSEAGNAVGTTTRYNGGASTLGRTTWLYNGTSTIDISLNGSEHTRDDNYKESQPKQLNESGQVLGYSRRYNGGSTDLGRSSWLYSDGVTTEIGLTGSEHTRNDGYRSSLDDELNEAGQAMGYSLRYNGGVTDLGQSAWLYDSDTDTTHHYDFSLRPSDGYAYSRAEYLGEDGLMLGFYQLFGTDDTLLGNRVFGFTLSDGFFDLGLQISGGLALFNWDHLSDIVAVNGMNQILGRGMLDSSSNGLAAFLATPTASAVPVPPAIWLFGSGLIGFLGLGRRKN